MSCISTPELSRITSGTGCCCSSAETNKGLLSEMFNSGSRMTSTSCNRLVCSCGVGAESLGSFGMKNPHQTMKEPQLAFQFHLHKEQNHVDCTHRQVGKTSGKGVTATTFL